MIGLRRLSHVDLASGVGIQGARGEDEARADREHRDGIDGYLQRYAEQAENCGKNRLYSSAGNDGHDDLPDGRKPRGFVKQTHFESSIADACHHDA